jgi:hypothetical protein
LVPHVYNEYALYFRAQRIAINIAKLPELLKRSSRCAASGLYGEKKRRQFQHPTPCRPQPPGDR